MAVEKELKANVSQLAEEAASKPAQSEFESQG